MLPSREILLYLLIGMSGVLLVLIVLILRKRGVLKVFGKKKEEGTLPGPGPSETGPTDHDSIKDTIKPKEVKDDVPKPSKGSPGKQDAQPANGDGVPKPPQASKKDSVPVPVPEASKPPAGESPFPIEPGDEIEGDNDIERGFELEDAAEMAKDDVPAQPQREIPKPAPAIPAEEEAESVGFVKMDGIDRPEAGSAKKTGILGRLKKAVPDKGGAPGEAPAPRVPEGTEKTITTASITGSPQDFMGQTVAIEGDLKLSSKGSDDVWYVLFDGKGTAVARSRQELPYTRARIIAKVEKTRLGQIYLDIVRHEKI